MSQTPETIENKPVPGKMVLSDRALEKLSAKYQKLTRRIRKKNKKLLAKSRMFEKKLGFPDSITTGMEGKKFYQSLEAGLVNADNTDSMQKPGTEYQPMFDSLVTGIQFLQKQLGNYSLALKQLGIDLHIFQKHWQNSIEIQSLLRNRRNVLKDLLVKQGRLQALTSFQKEIYYHQQQLNEYRDLLRQPDKLAKQLLTVAKQHPQFTSFMSRNSMLSQIFQVPGSLPANSAIAGLQTRSSTQQMIGQQLQGATGGSSPAQYLQTQVQAARTELNKLKDKLNSMGGSGDMEMPDFKPNTQKTKTFWKRIEWGMNIQSQRPNGWLPVTTDIAVTAGYKLTDHAVVGTGMSYKMGWGKNFSQMRITHQGVGLRSYMDIRLKGSIWISGGYELNHQQEFSRIDLLQNLDAWQKSGLIGMTKKFKAGKKNGNLQLLWDFLSYSQTPRTTALKFRIGYMF
ncbi:hypothetical protein [Sediminibacterium sp.]|uniref:hypothetical protein n=1 Tax=Sediminibacterium sp. TaxID=1917865 RepID=UPI0025DA994A|nr:hypothetical protein [Sediminibacterium sp.]MBW0176597.1 hypothetical protein [Sediminibacterium sp.]